MNKISYVVLLLLSVMVIGCKKTVSHKIRVQNEGKSTITKVTIGALTFANVLGNTSSEYREIPEGTYQITGDFTASNVEISGKGQHLWSLQVKDNKEVFLARDK